MITKISCIFANRLTRNKLALLSTSSNPRKTQTLFAMDNTRITICSFGAPLGDSRRSPTERRNSTGTTPSGFQPRQVVEWSEEPSEDIVEQPAGTTGFQPGQVIDWSDEPETVEPPTPSTSADEPTAPVRQIRPSTRSFPSNGPINHRLLPFDEFSRTLSREDQVHGDPIALHYRVYFDGLIPLNRPVDFMQYTEATWLLDGLAETLETASSWRAFYDAQEGHLSKLIGMLTQATGHSFGDRQRRMGISPE